MRLDSVTMSNAYRVAYFTPVGGRTEIFVDVYPPEAAQWDLDQARHAGLACWMCGWDWRRGMRDENVPYRLPGPDGQTRTACRPCHTRNPDVLEGLDSLSGPSAFPIPAAGLDDHDILGTGSGILDAGADAPPTVDEPIRALVIANSASVPARRISQASATSSAPVMQWPLIAATTGFERRSMVRFRSVK